MRTITLASENMLDIEMLHEYLQEELSLPDYYGKNLDALYDCLCDIEEELLIQLPEVVCENDYLGRYGEKLIAVFEDASEENTYLKVELI